MSVNLISTLGVVLASILFGLVPFFAKNLTEQGIPAAAIVFYKYSLTALVLLPFLRIKKDTLSALFWGIFAGIALGFGQIGYVVALKSAPVSTVGLLYMTFPMFTLVITWLWIGIRPTHRELIGAVLIFIAAIIALSPSFNEEHQLLTLLLSLTAPLGLAVSITTLTNKLIDFSPVARAGCLSIGCVIAMLPVILSLGTHKIIPASVMGRWLIIGITVITCLIPLFLYALNAPRIGAAKSAIAGGFELPTMFMVGWIAFDESISMVQLIAGAIIIFAIVTTPPRSSKDDNESYDNISDT